MTRDDSPAQSPTFVRYFVLAALCLAATIAYISRNCIGVLEEDIRRDLGLSQREMGWVGSAFFLTYALVQLPTGWLGHVWGSRKALPVFSTLWSLTTGIMALAWSLPVLILGRLGMGAAQAGIFPCCTNTIAKWLPPTRRAFAAGSLGSFMSVGSVISASLTAFLLLYMSWRWVFVLYVLPGVLWAAVFWLWFRNRPQEHTSVNDAELAVILGLTPDGSGNRQRGAPVPEASASSPVRESQGGSDEEHIQRDPAAYARTGPPPSPYAPERGEKDVAAPPSVREGAPEDRRAAQPEPTPWAAIFSSAKMWAINGQQFFRAAGYVFFTNWFTTYLKETRYLDTQQAGYLTSLPLLAVVLGTVTGGTVSDWLLSVTGSRRVSRQLLAVASTLLCAGFVVLAYFIDDALLAVLVISAGSFVASFAAPCAYTITIDMGGRHITTVFSTMNMSGNIGAFVFPIVVPELVLLSGSWDLVLFVFAGIYVAAAACWLLLEPRGTVFD